MTDPKHDMLEDIFAQARSVSPQPSDDLMARVLADAMQPDVVEVTGSPGLWTRLLDAVGGWPSVGGLATATVAGVWVGVSPPAAVEDMTAGLLGDAVSVSLFTDADLFDTGTMIDG